MDYFETSTQMLSDEGMFSEDVTMVTGTDNWTTTDQYLPPPPPAYIAALKRANKYTLITILIFLMLAMGCVVKPSDFKEVLRVPKSVLIGMLCQFVLMPLSAFCLALALSLPAPMALGVLVMSCCPGGTVSNLFTFWTKGDVCLSITMTTISTIAAIGLMPLNLFIYSRRWTDDNAVIPFVSIITALVSIVIPVTIGMIIRWKRIEWTSFISKVGSILGLLGIAITITLTAIINPGMYSVSWQVWICVLTLPALGATLGYLLSWALRRPPAHCRTIAYETGLQNVSLALTLIVLTFEGSPIMFQVFTYPSLYGPVMMVEGLLGVVVYKIVVRRTGGHEGGPVADNGWMKKDINSEDACSALDSKI
ncbi:ileal sodium/bile acid cotransporter-like [Lytechinus variegatus]|uniref:ileal sodium/bile acid cotransporter-like n=1 Tax=Lytechinus variegatus TaxID=7654 RepID=UPI001BB1FBB1|nr:ileal sodium/bile acid cotransporter-like [Lytechinus variegatus]